jgi:ribulose 1,5-bisphosphate synthetase/thiazole synthase
MTTRHENAHVAVVGTGTCRRLRRAFNTTHKELADNSAGPAGLAAIKSLLDEGFQVTAFEKRHAPGGVWAFTEDPTITSVTMATKVQLSKFLVSHSNAASNCLLC